MEMKKIEIKTETYDVGEGYRVDIITDNDVIAAWLYKEDYDTKKHVLGVSTYNTSYDEFLKIVVTNLDDFIGYYYDKVEDH